MRPERISLVSHTERMLHLSRAPAFARLDRDDLSTIAHYARERVFRKKAVLFDVDRPPRSLWLVVDGRIAVSRGGRHVVTVLPGFAVGGITMRTSKQNASRAVAETDVIALELDHDTMSELMEDRFSVTLGILRVLSGGLAQMLDDLPGVRSFPSDPGRFGATDYPPAPLDFVERIFFLRRGEVFARSSLDAVAEVARGLTELRLDAGDTLWRQGDPAETMVLVVHGELVMTPRSGRWTERVLAYGATGSLSNMAERPRRGTAVATRPTVALEAPRELLLDVLEDNSDMVRFLLEVLSDQYVELQNTVAADRERDQTGAPKAA